MSQFDNRPSFERNAHPTLIEEGVNMRLHKVTAAVLNTLHALAVTSNGALSDRSAAPQPMYPMNPDTARPQHQVRLADTIAYQAVQPRAEQPAASQTPVQETDRAEAEAAVAAAFARPQSPEATAAVDTLEAQSIANYEKAREDSAPTAQLAASPATLSKQSGVDAVYARRIAEAEEAALRADTARAAILQAQQIPQSELDRG